MKYLISLVFYLCIVRVNSSTPNSTLNAIVMTGSYDTAYNLQVNRSVEYIIIYAPGTANSAFPSRVNVKSMEASKLQPILVVVREKRGVLSWQLPLIVETRTGSIEYNQTSRSICPNNHYLSLYHNTHNLDKNGSYDSSEPIVSISTASEENVDVSILVHEDKEFYITDSVEYNITISPSEPRYYFYNFKPQNASEEHNYRTVVLQAKSEDDICMMISIQNFTCPVFDLEREIQFEGYWETMSTQGGITVTQSKFPNGFYVVFVVKGDDYDCTGVTVNSTIKPYPGNEPRVKNIKFIIEPSITYNDYRTAIMITLLVIASFYVSFLGIFFSCAKRHYREMTMNTIEADTLPPEEPSTHIGVHSDNFSRRSLDDDSSLSETDYDLLNDSEVWKDIYRLKTKLSVADLAKKNPKVLSNKANLYLWFSLIVAVFYGMPVIQLVIRYQKALFETGDQDLCYYNFLCAHPLGFLSDFNHVFSNIGYIALGVLFMLLVYRRQRMHNDIQFDKKFGIPQHYGIYYAMGCGLVMEGVLSGSYHVCPNHYNFQFDSSFMYVMAILSMIKIYQTRHPDINAKANTTFGVLAVAIFLGMVGIMVGGIIFWVAFTIFHILTCLFLTAHIYNMGRWKLDCGLFKRVFTSCLTDYQSGLTNVLIPHYKGRFFLLLIGNICNWALAAYGLINHQRDFATHLLAIFMGNTLLYTMFYISMKLIHKERLQYHVLLFLVLAFILWFTSLYFFINKSISWALTPAKSREFNHHCVLMHFYDGHDVWHYLSASAMFFSFMLLLTLDDDLTHTHRTKISVF